MASFTVDASAVLALLVPEVHTVAARRFFGSLSPADSLVAPAFMFVECTSNLRRKVLEGALPASEARTKLRQALDLSVRQVTDLEQHVQALDFANSRGTRRAYDEHYLAVALKEAAELVTVDGGMYQGALNFKIPARLLR